MASVARPPPTSRNPRVPSGKGFPHHPAHLRHVETLRAVYVHVQLVAVVNHAPGLSATRYRCYDLVRTAALYALRGDHRLESCTGGADLRHHLVAPRYVIRRAVPTC